METTRNARFVFDSERGQYEPDMEGLRRACNLLAMMLKCRVIVDGCIVAEHQPIPNGLRVTIRGEWDEG